MQKKLALLLVGTIILNLIPVNIYAFANTQTEVATSISGSPVVAPQHTALRQQGLQGYGTVPAGNQAHYFTEGTSLVLKFGTGNKPNGTRQGNIVLTSPMQIELLLQNAVFNMGQNIGVPQLQPNTTWNQATNILTINSNLGVTLQATPNTNRGVVTIRGQATPAPTGDIYQKVLEEIIANLVKVRNMTAVYGDIAQAINEATAPLYGTNNTLTGLVANANMAIYKVPYGDIIIEIDGIPINDNLVNDVILTTQLVIQEDTRNPYSNIFNIAVRDYNRAFEARFPNKNNDLDLETGYAQPPTLEEVNVLARNVVNIARVVVRAAEEVMGITPEELEAIVYDLAKIALHGAGYEVQTILTSTNPLIENHAANVYVEIAINAATEMNKALLIQGIPTQSSIEQAVTHAKKNMEIVHNNVILALLELGYPPPVDPPPIDPPPIDPPEVVPPEVVPPPTGTHPTNNIIPAGSIIKIPLIVKTTNNQAASVRIGQVTAPQGVQIQPNTHVFTIPTDTTTTLVPNPQTTRGVLPVNNITVQENIVGALPTQGAFELVAPTGYHFKIASDATVRATGGRSGLTSANTKIVQVGTNKGVVKVQWGNPATASAVTALNQNPTTTGAIVVNGLSLVATNNNMTYGNVYLQIRNVYGGNAVTNQSFLAGTSYANIAINEVVRYEVRVTQGSDTIVRIKQGQQKEYLPEYLQMDTAAYVSSASDSMMVPVRFVSMALGIPAQNIAWAAETSTVTVDTGSHIIQFQTNSSTIKINGEKFPMVNANGYPVYSEVKDQRAFIPFRALGNALNVYVYWDAQTSTAIFDPSKPANTTFATDIKAPSK